MHNQNFWLIQSNSTDNISTANLIKRDTAAAGASGMILRFRTGKAGAFQFRSTSSGTARLGSRLCCGWHQS
ncbi:hypothetical protein DFH09DRAFT_1317025 [Mycena vulgaris]|nr:hypothetical protein DFH09DRAFT_1317025 [Mycena vulgaris]